MVSQHGNSASRLVTSLLTKRLCLVSSRSCFPHPRESSHPSQETAGFGSCAQRTAGSISAAIPQAVPPRGTPTTGRSRCRRGKHMRCSMLPSSLEARDKVPAERLPLAPTLREAQCTRHMTLVRPRVSCILCSIPFLLDGVGKPIFRHPLRGPPA